jgi:hypothetical protein
MPPFFKRRHLRMRFTQAFLLHPARVLLATLLMMLIPACSERLEWREFKSPDGCSVMLPGRAQTVTRDVEFEGQKLSVSMSSTGVGPAMFALGVVSLPAGIANDSGGRERAIAYFRDGLVRNISGTMVSATPAALVLPPGSSAQVRAGQAVEARGRAGADGRAAALAARFFIVDDRLFQLIALGGEGSIEPQALDTFFTSFRLMP